MFTFSKELRRYCKHCGNVTHLEHHKHTGISPSSHYMTIMTGVIIILLLVLALANQAHW